MVIDGYVHVAIQGYRWLYVVIQGLYVFYSQLEMAHFPDRFSGNGALRRSCVEVEHTPQGT